MQDVYLARVTREKEEYLEGLRDAIFGLIGTDDEEIWADGRVTFSEEIQSVGITDYTIKFEHEQVGVIRGEVFDTGEFRFREI